MKVVELLNLPKPEALGVDVSPLEPEEFFAMIENDQLEFTTREIRLLHTIGAMHAGGIQHDQEQKAHITKLQAYVVELRNKLGNQVQSS